MNAPESKSSDCQVSGAELLPAETGGAAALCAAIARARGAETGEPITVHVRVISKHMLAATQTVGGRTLPEVHAARSDQPVGARTFEMLAQALAKQLAASSN